MSMRTKRISADEAFALRKDHLRGAELLKTVSAPASWNPGARSARFCMTSEARDRAGDVVVTAGLDIREFTKHPTAFLNHNSHGWPIGNWSNVQKLLHAKPPRMEGDLVLGAAGGPIVEIDQAAWAIENGLMRCCSIGFIPNWNQIERVFEADGSWNGGLRYNVAECIEVSLVGLPANSQAVAKGAARIMRTVGVKSSTDARARAAAARDRDLRIIRLRGLR
jgi:hypothetical protein